MAPEGWTFTRHALMRAVEMAIDASELRKALERPTRALPSEKYPGCHYIYTPRLVLCVDLAERVVITVIWNTWDGKRHSRFDRDDIELSRDSA